MGERSHAVRRAAVLALLAVGLAGCGRGERPAREAEPQGRRPPRLDPRIAASLPPGITLKMAQQGQDLFITACAACHGPDGQGTQLGPPLHDTTWIHLGGQPQEIARLIEQGVPEPRDYPVPMPPLGGGAFTAEQVRSLSAYVYALRAATPQTAQAPAPAAASPAPLAAPAAPAAPAAAP